MVHTTRERIFKTGIPLLVALLFCGRARAQFPTGEQGGIVVYGMMSDRPQIDMATGEGAAEGNVALLTSEGFLTGEKLQLRRKGELLSLEGNVFIVRNNQRILASRVVIDRASGEFVLQDVKVISDETNKPVESINRSILGFSEEEIAFEAARTRRLQELRTELLDLRESYVRSQNLQRMSRGQDSAEPARSEAVKKNYALLLERYIRTKYQPNLIFESLSPAEKKRYMQRRTAMQDFAQTDPELFDRFTAPETIPGYVEFSARRAYRNSEGILEFQDATLTPCRCGDDPPIYALSSRVAQVENEGYAFMYGSTFDIGSVPVVYTPFALFPVKRKRQSGFLRPYFYMSQSERVTGIPYYLTLGEHADATFTGHNFARRGWRLDGELRFQLSPESRLEVEGQIIEDKLFKNETSKHRTRIEQEIDDVERASRDETLPEMDPVEKARLEAERATPSATRWYARGAWNVPVTSWGATKFDVESVSDNRYLSDFSTDSLEESTASLEAPSQTAQRFLQQQTAVEYYGDDFTLSLRTQAMRDLYAIRPEETPMRLPRLEFHLLPRRYFDAPLVTEQQVTWERVHRLEDRSYVDLPGVADEGTDGTERNGKKDDAEPYVAGERLASVTSIRYPFPENNFVNATVGLNGAFINYHFDAAGTKPDQHPSLGYAEFTGDLSVPLFSELDFRSSEDRAVKARLRHDLVPRLTTSYIPEVARSENYPSPFQLFYAADDVTSTQEVHFYLNSRWTLQRAGFQEERVGPVRLPPEVDPGVLKEPELFALMSERGIAPKQDVSSRLFTLSDEPQAAAIYAEWAQKELDQYVSTVRAYEFDDNYFWPEQRTFRLTPEWEITPLSLGFHTSYNFLAGKIEEEKNRSRAPGDPYIVEEPWGDLEFTAFSSMKPLFPLTLNHQRNWSLVHERWTLIKSGLDVQLPLGFSFNMSRSTVHTKNDWWTTKREDSYLAGYQPFPWLKFEYRQAFEIEDRDEPFHQRPSRQFEYESTARVSFLHLQDCLDIVIARDKDLKQREVEATWSIMARLSYFGEQREVKDLGKTLNRAIHDSPLE